MVYDTYISTYSNIVWDLWVYHGLSIYDPAYYWGEGRR